jgi:hypothetical protein
MQLTGHTSTQDLSFTPMQGSAMMNGMISSGTTDRWDRAV